MRVQPRMAVAGVEGLMKQGQGFGAAAKRRDDYGLLEPMLAQDKSGSRNIPDGILRFESLQGTELLFGAITICPACFERPPVAERIGPDPIRKQALSDRRRRNGETGERPVMTRCVLDPPEPL